MDQKTRDMVNQALARYGASLSDDDRITKQDRRFPVQIVAKRGRLHFLGNGLKIASTPIASKSVSWFVETYWYWKVQNG